MAHTFRRIAVYCGSSQHADPKYYALAQAVGTHLAKQGIGIVYGGGRVGLMGALAEAALEAGGEVIGIIPKLLEDREVAHHGLTELYVVDGMPLRKSMMIQMSDAFLALPGGFGTWEEILEAATQGMLNYHRKPLGVLDLDGYYGPLQAMIAQGVEEKFVRPQHADLILFDDTLEPLLERMAQVEIPELSIPVGEG
ncbi:MAG: hypothetical protein ACI9VR_001621 [Cognaticolwellia sp.]|jgi:uncharacterized protein (TIGR00730 family)